MQQSQTASLVPSGRVTAFATESRARQRGHRSMTVSTAATVRRANGTGVGGTPSSPHRVLLVIHRLRDEGHTVRAEPPTPALERARAAFAAFADAHRSVIVEDKVISVALHFRAAPELADEARRLAEELAAELAPALQVQQGKMMVELRPAGGDKGSVVRDFMVEPPFAGRVPIFIGDDVTDEDGFRAVNALGGISVRVGEPGQPTEARYRIDGIEGVYGWLSSLIAATAERTE